MCGVIIRRFLLNRPLFRHLLLEFDILCVTYTQTEIIMSKHSMQLNCSVCICVNYQFVHLPLPVFVVSRRFYFSFIRFYFAFGVHTQSCIRMNMLSIFACEKEKKEFKIWECSKLIQIRRDLHQLRIFHYNNSRFYLLEQTNDYFLRLFSR